MRITHRYPESSARYVNASILLLALAAALTLTLTLILSPAKIAGAAAAGGTVSFATASPQSVTEGGSPVMIEVKRTCSGGCPRIDVQFSVAFAGDASSGDLGGFDSALLTFAVNQTTRTLDWPTPGGGLTASDDLEVEGTESLTITLLAGADYDLGATKIKTLNIIDNDGPPAFSFDDTSVSVSEGNSGSKNVTLTVNRSGAVGQEVTVSYATANGTAIQPGDYTAKSGTLEFDATQTSRTINIVIKGDTTNEGDETFTVTLLSPSHGGSVGGAATVTILDDDAPNTFSFDPPTYSVAEATGSVTVTVRRTNATGTASVDWGVTGGDVELADYQLPTIGVHPLTFAGGELTKSFTITIVKDTITESDETLILGLKSPSNGTIGPNSTATITIEDDEIGVPTVTGLSPNAGLPSGGNQVIVSGSSFVIGCQVYFGANQATSVTLNSQNQLTVVAPANGIAVVDVRVVCPEGTSANTSADDYAYTVGPTVTSITPPSGPATGSPPTFVTIIGTNFANVISVNFGTVSAIQYTVNSATMITAVAPTQPVGSYPVTVTTSAGTSPVNPNAYFTYTGTTPAGPVITNISPNSTPVNTTPTVTITGTGFSGATTVSFGGQVATIVGTPTATQIVVVAPSRVTPGTVRVVVTTPFGTSPDNASDSFTYGSPPPTGNVKTITLYARWSLITYQGPTREALAALKGVESPDDPRTNDVSGRVTAIFYWSANGAGCAVGESQCWLAWFPTGVGVPGANDFDNLVEDRIYWIAINGTGSVNWIYPEG